MYNNMKSENIPYYEIVLSRLNGLNDEILKAANGFATKFLYNYQRAFDVDKCYMGFELLYGNYKRIIRGNQYEVRGFPMKISYKNEIIINPGKGSVERVLTKEQAAFVLGFYERELDDECRPMTNEDGSPKYVYYTWQMDNFLRSFHKMAYMSIVIFREREPEEDSVQLPDFFTELFDLKLD